jgi:hypothetical protein
MMHKDGNKISVITNFNSKPEYGSVGDCVGKEGLWWLM